MTCLHLNLEINAKDFKLNFGFHLVHSAFVFTLENHKKKKKRKKNYQSHQSLSSCNFQPVDMNQR